MIEITNERFYQNRTWDKPLGWRKPEIFKTPQWVDLFDQNGYRLTLLEQEYSHANDQPYILHGDEKSLRKVWMKHRNGSIVEGPHINHAFLFERKGYSGLALEQLNEFAKGNNLIYKLINYKGKWGVDFSMDYVDSLGNSMELLHFEYDSYSVEEIREIKGRVEEKVVSVDWNWAAKQIIERKEEWINLEFFDQSKWKTEFFGLPAERFKMNAWE
jgi:hypothetical protein